MEKNIYTPEEEYWRNGGNTGTLPGRITPSQINVLESNEIFVFGSNAQGAHGGGAAYFAMQRFGAVWGIGEGLQGQSYAIPTMEGLESLAGAIYRFTSFAREHKELDFFVTAIGCGIAGYTPEDIAPLFFKLKTPSLLNTFFPVSFWKVFLDLANKVKQP